MLTLWPVTALTIDDLPTLGRPSNATKPDRNAISLRSSRLDLVQLAGVDVVHEAAHVVLVQHERRHLDPSDRLLRVEERVVEALHRPDRLDADLGFHLTLEVVLIDLLEPAVGVMQQ